MSKDITKPNDYQDTLQHIISTIKQNKQKAVASVNEQVLQTYWEIGRLIVEKQQNQGWGSKVITNLSRDLQAQFPNERGYSERNIKNMTRFYKSHPEFVQSVTAQLTFTHHITLIDRTKDENERQFYADLAIKHNWNTRELIRQIDSSLYLRNRLSKKTIKLSPPLKVKDPDPSHHFRDEYVLEFVKGEEIETEKEIEDAILEHLEHFFLEWGRGSIALLGRQYPCTIDNNEHRIDLLFYHIELNCRVALELKRGKFKAEYTGQMAKYLGYLNEKERFEGEEPAIGIILCEAAGAEEAKFAFSHIDSDRLKVATYTDKLPDEQLLRNQLQKVVKS